MRDIDLTGSQPLAAGGMAELRVVVDEHGTELVVKRLLPQLADRDDFRRALIAEGMRTRAVGVGVPKVVHIADGGRPMVVMERIHGVTLEQLAEQPVDRSRAVDLVVKLLVVLEGAHNAVDPDGRPMELVHRDVCPANVMITDADDVVLLDFGVATAAWPEVPPAGEAVQGRMGYMAPEQARGERVSVRADVFSVGVILYELLARCRYYGSGATLAIIGKLHDGFWPDVSERCGAMPSGLADIVRKATAPTPEQRFASAAEFARALMDTGAGR